MNENIKTTSIQMVVAIVLKELRLERGIHQAQVADALSKTPSAVAKMEMGQMTISMEVFYSMCSYHMVGGAQVLFAVERYAQLLGSNPNNWFVGRNQAELDALAASAAEYYSSPGFKRRQQQPMHTGWQSVLNGPTYWGGTVSYIPDVFRYAIDDDFRKLQNLANSGFI